MLGQTIGITGSKLAIKPQAWVTKTTTVTTTDAEGKEKTLTLSGFTPTSCNNVADKSGGMGSAQDCCRAVNGYWYQDHGIFNVFYNQADYCHEAPMPLLAQPLVQEVILGGSLATVGVLAYFLMKRRK